MSSLGEDSTVIIRENEWIQLLSEAKTLGVTCEEVRKFLQLSLNVTSSTDTSLFHV